MKVNKHYIFLIKIILLNINLKPENKFANILIFSFIKIKIKYIFILDNLILE